MTSTQPAPKSPVVQSLVGGAVLLVVCVLTLVVVAAVVSPSGQPDAPTKPAKRPTSQTTSADRRIASTSPTIVGTTLVEPWKFLAPVTVEKAADLLASAVIDLAANSDPDELTAWKAEIIVLDEDIQEHRIGVLTFDFQVMRRHLSVTGGISAQMEPEARAELTTSIQRELIRFDDIGVLTSGRSSEDASPSTASPLTPAKEPRYEWLSEGILVADFQIADDETAKDAAPRLVELGKDLCLLPGAELAKLRLLDAKGAVFGTLDLPLTSFHDFHSSDSTDRMIADSMWGQNAVLFLRDAGLR